MAITQEQVLAAVEKYLPRTVNYVHSAEFGTRDPAPVFERLQQILFTTLLVDEDAVFYLVYLASQRLLTSLDTVLGQLELLASTEQLKGITGDDPVRIEDLSLLTAARTSLVRLSTSVVREGSFGDANLTDFQSDLESFMSEQVVPALSGGSRVRIASAIRATMAELQTSWAELLEQRDLVFGLLDKYVAEDLRTRVSTDIISAIQDTLEGLESSLPALSTEEQAAAAEEVLIELAAAEAAITIIGGAPSPLGEVVAGPGEDGRSLTSYLALQSVGRVQPVLPVLTGEDGALRLEGPAAGAPFTSTQGQTVGSGLTDTLSDASVPDFTAEGIEAGMYLTLVDAGTTHLITSVTATKLLLSPRTPHVASVQRYAVTDAAPGRYFESSGSSFWDETTLTGTSTEIAAGASGSWVRANKVVATDGTNVYASGSDGVLRARKVEGASSTQALTSSTFTTASSDPGFYSNGVTTADDLYIVDPPNNSGSPYDISSLVGENELEIVGTWGANGGGPWYIEDPALTPFLFRAASGTFLSGGSVVGDVIVFSGTAAGAQDGTFSLTSVVDQTSLTPSTPPLTYETGVGWQLLKAANNRLYSASTNFRTSGVVVGDLVDVDGYGTYTVTAVTTTYLELDTAFPGTTPLTGLTFLVYGAPYTATLTFRQTLADFEALGVGPTLAVTEVFAGETQELQKQAILVVDGVSYRIQARVSATDLLLLPLTDGAGKVQVSGTELLDADADFVAAGVDPAKHALVLVSGPNAGKTYTITSVSTTSLAFTPSASSAGTDPDVYEIQPLTLPSGFNWSLHHGPSRQVFSSSFFSSDDVGSILVWRRGLPTEERIRVDSYVSNSEVWLAAPVDISEGPQPAALIRLVKPGMQLYVNSRRHTIVDVYDQTTLEVDPKLSNAPGTALDFIVMTAGTNLYSSRLYDPSGAALIDSGVGFGSSLSGATVHLMVDTPVKAKYVRAYDPGGDGFAEAFQVDANLRLGFRKVSYQVLVDLDNRSNLFRALEVSPLPSEGDVLTLWGRLPTFTVTAASTDSPEMELTVRPALPAGLQDQSYVVHTGGSVLYGKWLLYDALNAVLELEATTADLRLLVAEVLIEFGELNVLAIDSGVSGVVVDDGDADGSSARFSDSGASFASATFGDRLKVTYPDSSVVTTFVTVVLSGTELLVSPELPEGTALEWALERNSVSASLSEVERLRLQVSALRDLVAGYVLERNVTIDNILALLSDQRLDRAVDLLLEGRVDEFLNLEATTSSYATRARAAIQQVGASTTPTQAVLEDVAAGVAGATAAGVATSSGSGGATSLDGANSTAASYGSSEDAGEDVDVRVALAKSLSEIRSDEQLRSLVFTTFEEQRNRALFELCGEVESGFVSDDDPTLPWIAQTGSIRARVVARYQKALAAVQYLLDHPDKFEDIE